jgi:hypothetical protein
MSMIVLLSNNPLERFINLTFIDDAIILFVSITVLLLIAIYYFLYVKKRRHLLQQSVQKSLELWLSKAILEDYDNEEEASFHVPEKFIKHFRNPAKAEFALKELMTSKRNLTGTAADNVIKLYIQLGFKEHTLKKFRSKLWYKKAESIQQLYMMNQVDMFTKIYRHTNSSNEYVRMEAQTAVISFSGFEGLRFLEHLTYPMNEWQQVQLLEQLRPLNLIEMKRLPTWLRSSNETVVIFALKLVQEFQQFQVHNEVCATLNSSNEKLRYQAIKTLNRIATTDTEHILATQYQKETFPNKILILQQMRMLATKDNIGFLVAAAEENDDTIKLNAGRALVDCCEEGTMILEQKAVAQPVPYQSILSHIKAENSR